MGSVLLRQHQDHRDTLMSGSSTRDEGEHWHGRQHQLLPFTVSLVSTENDLLEAIALRAAAYSRHKAPAADKLHVAEEDDRRDDVAVLVARSKLDDGVLGTIRINPNFNAPMRFEASASLPLSFAGRRCAEFMRLGVTSGDGGRLVTKALAKASYEICVAAQIDYIFVASRPPVDLVYRAYMFDDLLNGSKVELQYAPGIPHSILCLPVAEAEQRWLEHSRPVHRFFVETAHPDIKIDNAAVARQFAAASEGFWEGDPKAPRVAAR